jgi:hypothetical protein
MTDVATETLRAVAERYREKATECRTKADLTNDTWAKQSFLEAAEFWMRLGVQAARRVAAMSQDEQLEERDPKPNRPANYEAPIQEYCV